MPRTLVLLNNVAIPRPKSGSGQQPNTDIISKLFETLKMKVSPGFFDSLTNLIVINQLKSIRKNVLKSKFISILGWIVSL